MKNAMKLQLTIAIVLNKLVSLLAIMHDKIMRLHYFFVLAINALAEINNFNLISF